MSDTDANTGPGEGLGQSSPQASNLLPAIEVSRIASESGTAANRSRRFTYRGPPPNVDTSYPEEPDADSNYASVRSARSSFEALPEVSVLEETEGGKFLIHAFRIMEFSVISVLGVIKMRITSIRKLSNTNDRDILNASFPSTHGIALSDAKHLILLKLC